MKHSAITSKIEYQLFNNLKLLIITTLLFLIAFIFTYPTFHPEPVQKEYAICGNVESRYPTNSTSDGATLFKNNCAACHNKNMKSESTGPALGGVTDRWENKALLYDFIRNSQAVIASKDAYAVALFNEYAQSVMTAFPNLTDEEIEALLEYIEH